MDADRRKRGRDWDEERERQRETFFAKVTRLSSNPRSAGGYSRLSHHLIFRSFPSLSSGILCTSPAFMLCSEMLPFAVPKTRPWLMSAWRHMPFDHFHRNSRAIPCIFFRHAVPELPMIQFSPVQAQIDRGNTQKVLNFFLIRRVPCHATPAPHVGSDLNPTHCKELCGSSANSRGPIGCTMDTDWPVCQF
jgi:hypothetical protein